MPASERVVACEGIHNLRDYGGYEASAGRLVTGRLFRSAQHREASSPDLEKVAGLDLAAVIDLRGRSEREAAPCPRPDGFGARVILVDDETINPADAARYARAFDSPAAAREALTEGYRAMPYRPNLQRLFGLYFEALAQEDGATLIHCLAGKDRTGLAVALFHHAMGVHRDDMMADYLLTNSAGNVEARVAAAAAAMRDMHGGDIREDALAEFLGVRAEYLETAFAAIRAEHGSLDRYLHEVLGVTAARRQELERRLAA
ncbi:hypothetical protein B5C34_03130 [Pacificimonas flava]|uniref:Protein tyrosine phosphatase n=3 Tax=Sphingosinicellaceae TaxID=2820280 RepID=A0A219B8K3_9SPHN|nr:tyrosine-protein phosphatase [Pacificimonas aurantium]OWV34611.1 hypothetical protein B5C34_03130 [Pacificimonas flava]